VRAVIIPPQTIVLITYDRMKPAFRIEATTGGQGFFMLKLTSRFVLEVLPYFISALVATVVVPGFVYSLMTAALPGVFYSEAHGMEAMVMPNVSGRENALELIRQDHDAFAPDQRLLSGLAKAAKDDLVNR
jgi:hypothetical protein